MSIYHQLLQITVNGADTASAQIDPNMETGEKTTTIWELVTSGGIAGNIVMATLFVLSVIAIYIMVERYRAITRANKRDDNFMNQIKEHIHSGKIDAAKSLCQAKDMPVARMIEKGISRIGKPLNDIGTAIENTGKIELNNLERNLSTLATISGAAPMIGFLGTVIGMIMTFQKMATAGGNIDIELLANGIYIAMVTTVGGLIVGIIAYIGYNILVAKVENLVSEMEAKTTEFLDILYEPAA